MSRNEPHINLVPLDARLYITPSCSTLCCAIASNHHIIKQLNLLNTMMNPLDLTCYLKIFVAYYIPMLIVLLISFWHLHLFPKQNKKTRSRANLPPSPPKLPIIGNLHQLGRLTHQSLWKLAQDHGPVMQLELGSYSTVVISSASMAKQVLKNHDLDFCTRPKTSSGQRLLSYNFLDVAFAPYGDYWREMRKLFVCEMFSPKKLQLIHQRREMELNCLINSVASTSSQPGTAINLDEKLCGMVHDIVCVFAFGENHRGEKYEGKTLREVLAEAMEILDGFSIGDFFPWIGWMIDSISGERKRLQKCFQQLDGYFQGVLDEHIDRRANPKPFEHDQDLADSLVARLPTDGTTENFPLTNNHIKAFFLDTFLGGIDTSSVTMAWAMSELVKNQRVLKKLQTEIRHLVGTKSKVEENDLPNMTYLRMVVRETLRLHPAAPLLLPHESIQHVKIEGYDIYPETRVLINAWAIGRDPISWKNPNEFYPERFENSEIDFRGKHFELVPFGAGRRLCPGTNMAILTIELTLANLLFSFDWEVVSGMKVEDIDMEEETGLVTRRKTPLFLVPIKHNTQAD